MLTKLLDESHAGVAAVIWRASSERVVARAGAPAPETSAAAKAAIEQQLRQAFDAGLREGEALGRTSVEQKVEEVVARLSSTIAHAAGTRAHVMARAEADVVRLAMDIARRVLHRELSLD